MKATGIVRRIDDLGRVVIPKENRHDHYCNSQQWPDQEAPYTQAIACQPTESEQI